VKHSWATLFLCSSLPLIAASQGPGSTAPWVGNVTPEPAQIQFQAPAQGTLRDYGIQSAPSEAPLPWVQDLRDGAMRSIAEERETASKEIDFDVQIFISSGMPEGVLRSLFKQALDEGGKRVRFVVRGFEPQKVGELLKKLRMLLPDPYKDDVLVEVDPNAFRAYEVKEVPVYLVKNKEKWYAINGTVSIDGARERVKEGGNYTSGELYAITEPDILSIIEDRASKYDWETSFARARERAAVNLKPHFDLPTVIQDSTDYFTPTFTVPEDVTGPGPDGKGTVVLGRAGQVINLLQHTTLQVPVIAFDATDPNQVRLVQSWVTRPEYRNADLFIVGSSVETPAGTVVMEEIGRKLKRPVFPMFKRLGERFGVQAVPAIIEQEGDRLRIRYFNPQNKKG